MSHFFLPVPIEQIVNNGGHGRKNATVRLNPERLDLGMCAERGFSAQQTSQMMQIWWHPVCVLPVYFLTESCVAVKVFLSP
jgi:hypothetical protein